VREPADEPDRRTAAPERTDADGATAQSGEARRFRAQSVAAKSGLHIGPADRSSSGRGVCAERSTCLRRGGASQLTTFK
jgi:hypothetical protein